MCETSERHSTICGHRAVHKDPCTGTQTQSIFKVFAPKCAPTKSLTSHYELCHSCRRFWHAHGVGESEAMRRTLAYRQEHNFFGPISPHSFNAEEPVLMQDIDIYSEIGDASKTRHTGERVDQITRRGSTLTECLTRGGDPYKAEEWPRGPQQELTEWMVKQNLAKSSSSQSKSPGLMQILWPRAPIQDSMSSSRRDSSISTYTLWPRVVIQGSKDPSRNNQDEGNKERLYESKFGVVLGPNRPGVLIHPDQFEIGEPKIDHQPNTALKNPDHFELQGLKPPPRAKLRGGGVEVQALEMPSDRQPVQMSCSDQAQIYQIIPVQDVRRANVEKALPLDVEKRHPQHPPDLNKQLPPLPSTSNKQLSTSAGFEHNAPSTPRLPMGFNKPLPQLPLNRDIPLPQPL